MVFGEGGYSGQYLQRRHIKRAPINMGLCPAPAPFNYQRAQSLPRSTRCRSYPNLYEKNILYISAAMDGKKYKICRMLRVGIMGHPHLDAGLRTTIVLSKILGGPPLRFRVIFCKLQENLTSGSP